MAFFMGSLQIALVSLDHLLDHLAADRTGLAGGQVAVVALLQVDADFLGCPYSILNTHLQRKEGLPWWLKTLSSQCKGPGFNP